MKTLIIVILLSGLNADNMIEKDLAFRLVRDEMQNSYVPEAFLREVFTHDGIAKHKEIPERFARPYEKKSWEEYRKLFIKESRIVAGERFYLENVDLIQRVVDQYRVDPFIIVSIAGIESNYGSHYKGFTVFNSLYTQIHEMPKRASWASRELAAYLEYCFHDQIDPHILEGSYAGAFGFGQFIPSSFTRFAVDFDEDGVRRPHDWPDVLASISNYQRRNGYVANSSNYERSGDIWKSIWAYNHADNYVMAVLELSEKIRERIDQDKRDN